MEGHDNLVKDLEVLLNDARAFEFHDYKNTRFATPKIALMGILTQTMKNIEEGKYDN